MTRLATLFSLALVLSAIPGGLAGPGCARKHFGNKDCVEICKKRWGWTGKMFGKDRWGFVAEKFDKSEDNWEAVIAQACGLPAPSHPAASASSAAPIQPSAVIGTGSSPAESELPESASAPVSSSAVDVTAAATSVQYTASSPAASSAAPVVAPATSSAAVVHATTSSTVVVHATTSSTVVVHASTSVKPTPVPATTKAPTSQAAPPATTSQASSGSGGSTSANDIQAYLIAHNNVRSQHGAAPLVWSNNLASKAQQWANGCQFKHSGGSLGPFGENLAAGTGSDYDIAAAVKSWTDEVSQYNANNPQPSHFTQVVWKGSQQVGCAVQECSGIFASSFGPAKYYVCEYSPAGNVIGEFAQNVQV